MSDLIYEKTSTGATPWGGGHKRPGIYGQHQGSVNPDPRNGPSGGYCRQETIDSHGGSMLRPSLAGTR
jgi:hypothetical protein